MFLYLLESDEQRLFCQAVLHMVRADRVLHAKEEALQESILRELTADSYPEPGDLQDVLARLSEVRRPVASQVFALELAGVATADGEVHPAERALLERVADALGVQRDRLDAFLDFGARARDLHDEGRVLVAEG